MFLVDARPDEINNRDVMARLTASAEAVAEHEAQGRLQHRFVGLLKAGLFVESQDLVRRG